jgi:hypothetical protein
MQDLMITGLMAGILIIQELMMNGLIAGLITMQHYHTAYYYNDFHICHSKESAVTIRLIAGIHSLPLL